MVSGYVDVVDENDNVIGQMPERESNFIKNGLRRSSVVLVFNSEGKLFLQKRAASKDRYPLHWCVSAAGLLDQGEDYLSAAVRELEEEIGIKAEPKELKFITKVIIETAIKEFESIYCITYDGPIQIDQDEVVDGKFFSLEEIQKMYDGGEKITDFLIKVLKVTGYL